MGCGKRWGPAALPGQWPWGALLSVPASRTRVHALSSCTLHCASCIIVHALSSCVLRRCVCSIIVHTAPSRALHLHRCAHSIAVHTVVQAPSSCALCLHVCCTLRAPASCTLHLCVCSIVARSIFTCSPSSHALYHHACSIAVRTLLCKLHRCAHFIFTYARSCMFHHRPHSIIAPTCGHRGQTQIRQLVAGWDMRSVPQNRRPPAPAQPQPARVNTGGEDACEPSCQFRNECCL